MEDSELKPTRLKKMKPSIKTKNAQKKRSKPSRNELRRGIFLSEILRPPRALRPYRFRKDF